MMKNAMMTNALALSVALVFGSGCIIDSHFGPKWEGEGNCTVERVCKKDKEGEESCKMVKTCEQPDVGECEDGKCDTKEGTTSPTSSSKDTTSTTSDKSDSGDGSKSDSGDSSDTGKDTPSTPSDDVCKTDDKNDPPVDNEGNTVNPCP